MGGDDVSFQLMNRARSLSRREGTVRMESPGGTDHFIDPAGAYRKDDAPFYCLSVAGDFTFRCQITPEFTATYDAGGILVRDTDECWIKLAFEKTDLGTASVVSVVTDKTSDDCNGETVDGPAVWLQVSRKGNLWAMHYSVTGRDWRMVRYCALPMGREVSLGLMTQSPAGNGCTVTFAGVELLHVAVENMRTGK